MRKKIKEKLRGDKNTVQENCHKREQGKNHLSSQHLAAVPTPNIAEFVPSGFVLSGSHGFCGGTNTFSQENNCVHDLTAGIFSHEKK